MGVQIAGTEYSSGLGEFNYFRDRSSNGHVLILQYVGVYKKVPTENVAPRTSLGNQRSKSGPPKKAGRPITDSERSVVVDQQFRGRIVIITLGFLGAIQREDRDCMDLDGTDLRVGALGLKLPIRSSPSTSMKAPFLRERAHSPNLLQTTIRCHSVRVLYSPESLSFQLTLVATENRV
jgi:hypothetical protein